MRIFAFIAIFFLLPLGSSLAQETDPTSDILGRVFSEVERQVIEDYYRGRGHGELGDEFDDDFEEVRAAGKQKGKGKGKKDGLPPGLAKRDKLPPGLE